MTSLRGTRNWVTHIYISNGDGVLEDRLVLRTCEQKEECDSLTGSHLICSSITAACSNLNKESRVSHVPTLTSRGVA